MQFYRNLLIGVVAPPPAGPGKPRRRFTLPAPGSGGDGSGDKRISKRLTIAWFAIVGVAIIACIVLWFLSGKLLGDYRYGLGADVVICAFVIGFWFVFILPSRVVSAIFGALGGSGAQNALTGEGIITQSQVAIEKVATAASYVTSEAAHFGTDFLHTMAVVFYLIVLLLSSVSLFAD
jgi:hypothetical protein